MPTRKKIDTPEQIWQAALEDTPVCDRSEDFASESEDDIVGFASLAFVETTPAQWAWYLAMVVALSWVALEAVARTVRWLYGMGG